MISFPTLAVSFQNLSPAPAPTENKLVDAFMKGFRQGYCSDGRCLTRAEQAAHAALMEKIRNIK